MLRFINQFLRTPVQSLRTSRRIGLLSDPIIDPNDLSIAAFYVDVRTMGGDIVLFTADIREFSGRGVLVDSEDNLMETEGLVRLAKLQKIDYQIVDKKVITKNKQKVGRVTDYTIDDRSFRIEKLYVKRTLVKSLSSGELIIGRRQIVEVNDNEIIVKDPDVRVESRKRKASFNPLAN